MSPSREIAEIAIASLHPWKRNARTHSKKQIRQIADSIKRFGFTNPVLIDEEMNILAGHGRAAAAKVLGLAAVPCLRIDSMSAAEKKAYVLADNKLALNAGWDDDLLAAELQELAAIDPTFDLTLTGFDLPEIEILIEADTVKEAGDPRNDALPEIDETQTRCKPGDIWQMGPHRLVCGDMRDPSVIEALMMGEKAEMVFTDPPYNVPIDGHVSGLGAVKHREFACASGEMTRTQFTGFLRDAMQVLIDHSIDGSIHFVCMDWRHMGELMEAGSLYTEFKNLIVWAKDNGGMGTFYRSRHELIFAFKNGTAPHINTFELGQHGRYRTNVWEYRGANSIGKARQEELALHPTVKPVAMIVDAIKDCSRRNSIILDIFGGSGSTLIAAHKTGRRGYLLEIDPIYCERILRRWEKIAKDDAEYAGNIHDPASRRLH